STSRRLLCFLSSSSCGHPRALHSFPTRRSSDLLQEDQAGDVFQGLYFIITFQPPLEQQIPDPLYGFLVVTLALHDGCGRFAMELGEITAPALVTLTIHGVITAWDLPAADMLSADGQLQGY